MSTDGKAIKDGAAKRPAPGAVKKNAGAHDEKEDLREAPLKQARPAREGAEKTDAAEGAARGDGADPLVTGKTGAASDTARDVPPDEAYGDAGEAGKGDDELNAKYMRLAADFQNYKRRAEKEKSDIYAYANEKIISSLLDMADNFERALEHNTDSPEESFLKGMELIFRQLLDVLAKNGAEEIVCLGEEFDPSLHHAVMVEEGGPYESGRVSEVLKKGYRLKEKVIRPAMVKVAQ